MKRVRAHHRKQLDMRLTRYPGYMPGLPHPNVPSWLAWYKILLHHAWPGRYFWMVFWYGREP